MRAKILGMARAGVLAAGCLLAAALTASCGGGGDGEAPRADGQSPAGGDKLQIRSPFDDYGNAIAVNSAGGVYAAGSVGETLEGQISAGRDDAIIIQFDASLAQVSAIQFGTDNHDSALALAVDDAGAIYVAGSTIGQFPGFTTQFFGSDAFVRVYESDASVRWTTQFGAQFETVARDVDVDQRGAVYVGGYTAGSLPGHENAGGAPLGSVTNWNDAFLKKFSADGAEEWSIQFGHERHDEILGIAASAEGFIYVAGYTDAKFEGFSNPGGRDAFVRKYDAAGNVVWTTQFGSASSAGGQPNDKALDVALAPDGSVYVVGSTTGVFDGERSGGSVDGFVRKMSADGDAIWTRQFGGEDGDTADAVAIGSDGAVYLAGKTESSIPGAKGAGVEDGYAKSFDADGGERWTRGVGTRRIDGATGIAVASEGVYVVGGTEGEIGPGGAGKGDDVDSDVFVLRFRR